MIPYKGPQLFVFFQLLHDDLQSLTTLQAGAYMLLVTYYMRNKMIPRNDHEIRRIASLDVSEWDICRDAVMRFFTPTLTHLVLDHYIRKAEASSDRSRQNVRKRWDKEADTTVSTTVSKEENRYNTTKDTPEIPQYYHGIRGEMKDFVSISTKIETKFPDPPPQTAASHARAYYYYNYNIKNIILLTQNNIKKIPAKIEISDGPLRALRSSSAADIIIPDNSISSKIKEEITNKNQSFEMRCRNLVGSEPVLLDSNFWQIDQAIRESGGLITEADFEVGISEAMKTRNFRPRAWSQLIGWGRGAAKKRLASEPRKMAGNGYASLPGNTDADRAEGASKRDMLFIKDEDRDWAYFSNEYKRRNGKTPPRSNGGWYFPKDWRPEMNDGKMCANR